MRRALKAEVGRVAVGQAIGGAAAAIVHMVRLHPDTCLSLAFFEQARSIVHAAEQADHIARTARGEQLAHFDDDLSFRASGLDVVERLPGLRKRENAVDHRPDVACFN